MIKGKSETKMYELETIIFDRANYEKSSTKYI